MIYGTLDTERANIACRDLISKQELAPRLFSIVGETLTGLSHFAEMSFFPALLGFCIKFHLWNKKQDSILMYLYFILDCLVGRALCLIVPALLVRSYIGWDIGLN
jgi:hypothetical protein